MKPVRMSFIACALFIIVGCSAQPEQAKPTDDKALNEKTEQVNTVDTPTEKPAAETPTEPPTEPPTAMQILKNSGLMPDDNYVSAEFIPNSDDTMIVADIREVPCKMIFRYITTTNGDYWMPNQIGCSP